MKHEVSIFNCITGFSHVGVKVARAIFEQVRSSSLTPLNPGALGGVNTVLHTIF